jgi:hypothetical protein
MLKRQSWTTDKVQTKINITVKYWLIQNVSLGYTGIKWVVYEASEIFINFSLFATIRRLISLHERK